MTQITTAKPLALELETCLPGTESEASDPAEYVSLPVRIANLLAITLPLIGFVTAIVMLWGVAFNWAYLGLLLGGYLLTGLGITVGFHRYFTHKSFETSRPVQAVLGVLGSMALEGPLLTWAAMHRQHHQHSDRDKDPHSPHTHGDGLRGFLAGLFHSHCGWLLSREHENADKYVPDLRRDPLISFISRTFLLWTILGLLIPAAIGGLVAGNWTGVFLGFLWGGLGRIFLVHHITWSVNSVCHIWGTRPFRSQDHSRNNALFGLLAFGEGWHNNHHAFPASAKHGLSKGQFDLSYQVIRGLSLLGLAWDVRVPSRDRLEAKLRA